MTNPLYNQTAETTSQNLSDVSHIQLGSNPKYKVIKESNQKNSRTMESKSAAHDHDFASQIKRSQNFEKNSAQKAEFSSQEARQAYQKAALHAKIWFC